MKFAGITLVLFANAVCMYMNRMVLAVIMVGHAAEHLTNNKGTELSLYLCRLNSVTVKKEV